MSDKPYDSSDDTFKHKDRVFELVSQASTELARRGWNHDMSKLEPPEKPLFDAHTTALKGLRYGSDEYKAQLSRLEPALVHHYLHNSHHPEHWVRGIRDMSLLDLLEMLADWKAAGERHQRADHNLANSLRMNKTRFNIPDDIYQLLWATAVELGWVRPEDKEALL